MNKFILVLIIIFLSSCATTHHESYFDVAHRLYQNGELKAAYRFFEDYFDDGTPEGQQAIDFVKSNKKLLQEGLLTFSIGELNDNLPSDDINMLGVAKNEKKRLLLFKIVAPEIFYKNARSNYDTVFPNYFDRIEEIEKEIALKAKEEKRKEELAKINKKLNLLNAIKNAKYICPDTKKCKKAFAHTQIFVNEYSTMKIQLATDAIIETYNITKDTGIAMKAVKTPLKQDSEEISITISCKPSDSEECYILNLKLYKLFPIYLGGKLN